MTFIMLSLCSTLSVIVVCVRVSGVGVGVGVAVGSGVAVTLGSGEFDGLSVGLGLTASIAGCLNNKIPALTEQATTTNNTAITTIF